MLKLDSGVIDHELFLTLLSEHLKKKFDPVRREDSYVSTSVLMGETLLWTV